MAVKVAGYLFTYGLIHHEHHVLELLHLECAQSLRAHDQEGTNQQVVRFDENGRRKPFDGPELINEELHRSKCAWKGVGNRLDRDGFLWRTARQDGAVDGSAPLFICGQSRDVACLPSMV